ncbi:hypothetical protein GS415_02355 [Rhodococcus hoagii]|nr:hypothetical protein [Prescottella equi]
MLGKLGGDDKMTRSPWRSRETALTDEYFIERSCTRTWTSTRADLPRDGLPTRMFTVLFALGACPAGSRTGVRCKRIRPPRSAVRVRSTPATRSASYVDLSAHADLFLPTTMIGHHHEHQARDRVPGRPRAHRTRHQGHRRR